VVSSVNINVVLSPGDRRAALLNDALTGLTTTPKVLSPIWFYDERGSMLFDEITRLPEYYPTRVERALLEEHSNEIVRYARADALVELGSGTSEKTRILLNAMRDAGILRSYVGLDVSEDTLRAAADALAIEYPGMSVTGLVADFHSHLESLPSVGKRLVAFLGSTIGNLTPPERAKFLFDLDCQLGPDDRLLLGVDLVKDVDRLVAAYNDAAGVTAEFNRNALRVINAELDADFVPERFEHVAFWDAGRQWMDIRLRANTDHVVQIGAVNLEVPFARDEELRTEISAKFTPNGIAAELEQAGFIVEHTWNADGDFLLLLARPYC
jgi:L-histidine N-alpha-methyltransferase